MCHDFNLYLVDAERVMTMPRMDSHCRQWAARSGNKGVPIALIMSGSATQGQASTTLDTETTPGTRQRQKDECHQHSFMLGRAPTNKPSHRRKEVGIYVPADVDDKDNAI
jgi:hypothetical protein